MAEEVGHGGGALKRDIIHGQDVWHRHTQATMVKKREGGKAI
jgi:hypothetical protein